MTSLNIEQSTSLAETVTSDIIEKLYYLAITSNVEDQNSQFNMSLSGSIYANAAYESSVLYLRAKFPNLTINVRDNNFYIKFADRTVENVLVASQYCSDGVGFSLTDASLMSSIPTSLFNGNTTITTFDELNKFGSIGIANDAFYNCSNLTSINLQNVTTIGNKSFYNCSSLSQVLNVPNLSSLGTQSFRNTGITSIENLGNVITSISNGAFQSCTALTSINLPQQVTAVGDAAFNGDSNLTSFDFSNILSVGSNSFRETGLQGELSIPNLSGTLGYAAFRNCKNLTSVTNLGTITQISPSSRNGYDEGTFTNCTSLQSIVIPTTVTLIGNDGIKGCTNLSQVTCSWQNLITLKNYAFNQHAAWNFILSLTNLTTLGANALGYSRNPVIVKQIYLPKITTGDTSGYYRDNTYYEGCFSGLISDVIYLRDIQYLYPGDFGRTTCNALVINNVTPPVWRNKGNKDDSEVQSNSDIKSLVFASSAISNIYVPDSAVTTYQNDENWSTMASKIKPLSTLTKVATEADLQSGQVALIEAYM